jgi:hypothetical protein
MSAGVRMFKLILGVLMLGLSFSSPTHAATRNAIDCSAPAVIAAINSAASGDTVQVPPGNCTWSSVTTLPTSKDLTLLGAGSGSTLITCPNQCLVLPSASTTRVSGFSFTYSGSASAFDFITVGKNDTPGTGKTFRFDHNVVTASQWTLITVYGGGGANSGVHPTGVVDHNTFNNMAVHVLGTNFMRTEGPAQDDLWSQTTTLGDGTNVVYIEDNAFTGDVQNYTDGNYGSRYVVRFNTMTGHATGVEVHSVQGNNRAVQRWEIYKNTFSKVATSFYPVAFIRGGTGVVFGNRVSATFTNDILLDNIRSQGDPGQAVGACGMSSWDQNTSGQYGYACRDQIGRGKDNARWTTDAAYTQDLKPVYFWDNIKGTSTLLSVLINTACGSPSCLPAPGNNPLHLVENRDWYRQTTSFTGATGVGQGPLASRPTTCTTGVAYWATDVGKWNNRVTSPDGQLFKCTSTNTWTLYYVPYAYPHPLQASQNAPAAPSGLKVQ